MATASSPTAVSPAALHRGDTIALLSPSARLESTFPLRISRAVAFLSSKGFAVKVMSTLPSTLPSSPPSSPPSSFRASIAARADEVHAAFANPQVKAIICCIGGLAANELLPALDYNLIRKHPKIFVGSSDITLLHHALLTQAGLRTFYGPSVIAQWGEYPTPLGFTWAHFRKVVGGVASDADRSGTASGAGMGSTGTDASSSSSSSSSFAYGSTSGSVGLMPRSSHWTDEFLDWTLESDSTKLRARHLRPNDHGWKWLRAGRAEGRIGGGCLPSLLQLSGTVYQLDYTDKILLLELPEGMEVNKPWPLELARCNLGDLRMHGVWSKIKGLVLGRPYMHTEAETKRWEDMVLERTEGFEWPILAGVDVGHTDPMLTVPLDQMCWIDSERDEWGFWGAAVVE